MKPARGPHGGRQIFQFWRDLVHWLSRRSCDGLHGVLPPFLHKSAASRTAFLASAGATTRQALGAA
jgi:hypothetical protein